MRNWIDVQKIEREIKIVKGWNFFNKISNIIKFLKISKKCNGR